MSFRAIRSPPSPLCRRASVLLQRPRQSVSWLRASHLYGRSPSRYMARFAPRWRSSRATGICTCSCRRSPTREDYRRARRRRRGDRGKIRARLFISKATRRPRPAPQRHQGHARPRRDRGEHPSRARAGTSWSRTPTTLYEEARAGAARHREVHARRPPHRHRRRQPHRARRRARRPTARSCAGPICCAA